VSAADSTVAVNGRIPFVPDRALSLPTTEVGRTFEPTFF
jgi:hypothetical protein